MSDNQRCYVVRCGNHYLQSDDNLTAPEWVSDLAKATRHTKEWADDFQASERTARRDVNISTFEDAYAFEQIGAADALKQRWLNAFEQAAYTECTGVAPEGLWPNAHMYYGQGLTVAAAVDCFASGDGPRSVKRKPVVTSPCLEPGCHRTAVVDGFCVPHRIFPEHVDD